MEEMNSLDIYYALKELRSLQGGRIQKIYQRDKRLRIQIYAGGESYDLLLEPGKIYVSEYDRKGPAKPPNFCMFLRKYLRNKTLREIRQHKFDRIVELHTEEYILVCELFGRGNFVLVDRDGEIVQPLEVQKWSERKVSPGKKYKYPPAGKDPRKLGSREFGRLVKTEDETVRKIARDLNLGGRWAEEACLRAGVEKSKPGEDLGDAEVTRLRKSMVSLFKEELNPGIFYEDEMKKAAVPFPLKKFGEMRLERYDSFNRALDDFFSGKERKEVEEEAEETKEEELSRVQRIREEQEEAEEKWGEKQEKSEKKAELIYQNYTLVEDVLNGIQKAMNSDISWSEIKDRIDEEDTPQARAVKEVRENQGTVLVEIEDEEVELDFRKSVEENAESFYETKKKSKDKIEKIKEKKKEIIQKEKSVEQKDKEEFTEEGKERAKPEKEIEVKEEGEGWYKKYRWFKTSEGFLVVAGKNADQNEELVKKKAQKDDVILHAEIEGSPFTVIKTEDREVTPLAIREASEFCASFSKAWKRGLGSVDVYWVRPEQVSKDAPSGEYIGKGSFMIKGDKNYLKKTGLKISIGVKLDREENKIRVFNGSTQSVRNRADYFVSLNPGNTEKSNLAKQVVDKLAEKAVPEDRKFVKKIDKERVKPLMPPGGGILVG
ncbi:MAG: ribosome rescue protein RqcH [Candidatus Aenigmatarchaeota archaeon]